MDREATLLKLANSAGIGPKLIKYSNNFIMMEFIDGLTIIDWIMQKNIAIKQVLNVVLTILNQCYILDKITNRPRRIKPTNIMLLFQNQML